ncbi:T9SS type A sorting domain-containing protein [Bacteroidota bacterium]
MDVKDLPAGFYVITAEDQDEKSIKKFIIR